MLDPKCIYQKSIFAKCIRLACLLSFASLFCNRQTKKQTERQTAVFQDFPRRQIKISCISIWQLWLVGPVKVKFVDQAEEDLVVPLKKPGKSKHEKKVFPKKMAFTQENHLYMMWRQSSLKNSPVQLLEGVRFYWWFWTSL